MAGSEILAGCSNDFRGCAETRTCTSGTGGSAGAGEEPEAGAGGTSGKGGGSGGSTSAAGDGSKSDAAGKGGAAGKSAGHSTESSEGGAAGEPEPASGDAGSDNGGGLGTAGQGTGSGDGAPRIVSTTPATGARGVLSDVEIDITFSEPMNNETTEAAFHSNELPAVQLSWRKNNTVLVVEPTEPLVYASVTDPAADAKFYSFSVSGTATDMGGKPMGDERTFVFTTLRHVTQKLRLAKGRQVARSSDGTETVSSTCTVDSTVLFAGDDKSDAGLGFVVGFDYTTLAPDVVSWESARLSGQFARHTDKNPFSRLGSLNASRIIAPDLAQAKYSSEAALDFGTAASVLSAGAFDLDVVEGLRSAYANRATEGNRLVARFKFETPSDGDGEGEQIDAPCNQVALDVTYTAP